MSFQEIKELSEAMKKGWEEFKTNNNKQIEELKKGFSEAILEEKLQRINAAIDDKEKKIQEKLKDLEAKMDLPRPGSMAAEAKALQSKEHFIKWCRTAKYPDDPELAKKALIAADDTTGGYLIPPEFIREIIKTVTEISPVRSVARVRVTSGRSSMHPKRTGQFAAVWIAEQGTRNETTGLKYGREEIPNHEIYARVDISKQDLDDSAFDLEAEIRGEMAEQFAVAEGLAFLFGNGVGKPEGILVHSDVLLNRFDNVTGASNTIASDDLITVFYNLKDPYARNASWLFKRSVIGKIRKLKATTGDYVWQPGLAADKPPTILGQPYQEAVDMQDTGAAGNALALFGDFSKGYVISDRQAIDMFRDPFTERVKGNIKFQGNKRLGGQVVLSEAFRWLRATG